LLFASSLACILSEFRMTYQSTISTAERASTIHGRLFLSSSRTSMAYVLKARRCATIHGHLFSSRNNTTNSPQHMYLIPKLAV